MSEGTLASQHVFQAPTNLHVNHQRVSKNFPLTLKREVDIFTLEQDVDAHLQCNS